MDFSERVRRLREKAGMTQVEVADKLGLTNRAVGAWEAGRARPRLDKMTQLAELFGVPVSELMGEPGMAVEGAPTGLAPLLGSAHMGDRDDDTIWLYFHRHIHIFLPAIIQD